MHVPPREYAGQSSSLTNQFSPSTLGLRDCPQVVKLAGQVLLFADPPCPPLTPTRFTMQNLRRPLVCPLTPSVTKDSIELLFLLPPLSRMLRLQAGTIIPGIHSPRASTQGLVPIRQALHQVSSIPRLSVDSLMGRSQGAILLHNTQQCSQKPSFQIPLLKIQLPHLLFCSASLFLSAAVLSLLRLTYSPSSRDNLPSAEKLFQGSSALLSPGRGSSPRGAKDR